MILTRAWGGVCVVAPDAKRMSWGRVRQCFKLLMRKVTGKGEQGVSRYKGMVFGMGRRSETETNE